jgi:pSer/pThr/pTyr-binding forkhead associated (FHA) protein
VPDSLLAILKWVFLGLLYLFFVRVIRAVWVEVREPKSGAPAAVAAPPSEAEGQKRSRRGGPKPAGRERLVILEPAERKGQTFDLNDELTVGRAPGCAVSLDDTFVSSLHARVFRRDGTLYVEDLGSTNGTFVNKKAVNSAVKLRKGDRVQVGRTVMELNR